MRAWEGTEQSGATGRVALPRLEHDHGASVAGLHALPTPKAELGKSLHCLETCRCPEGWAQEPSAGGAGAMICLTSLSLVEDI